MAPRPSAFIPKVSLPYPVGRVIAGRMVRQLSPGFYQIDLSGRMFTAEVSSAGGRKPFSTGDTVYVRVTAKSGTKALLQIVEPDFPDIVSPKREDFLKLARAAGWPEDEAGVALVAALVSRRLPLRSDLATQLYRHLKSIPAPTAESAEKFLIDFFRPNA